MNEKNSKNITSILVVNNQQHVNVSVIALCNCLLSIAIQLPLLSSPLYIGWVVNDTANCRIRTMLNMRVLELKFVNHCAVNHFWRPMHR